MFSVTCFCLSSRLQTEGWSNAALLGAVGPGWLRRPMPLCLFALWLDVKLWLNQTRLRASHQKPACKNEISASSGFSFTLFYVSWDFLRRAVSILPSRQSGPINCEDLMPEQCWWNDLMMFDYFFKIRIYDFYGSFCSAQVRGSWWNSLPGAVTS